jgi:hypothetical protein
VPGRYGYAMSRAEREQFLVQPHVELNVRASRLKIVLVAAFTSAAVLIEPGVASAAVSWPAGSGAAGAGAGPGSVLWTSSIAGGGNAVAADPKGGMVLVAGSAGLVAYDVGTGAQLWDNSAGAGLSAAVTPDGRAVFVVNPVRNSGGNLDFFTAAFDTATGNRCGPALQRAGERR